MATTGSGKLTAWDRQLKNRNFLSPAGFKFNLSRAPKVDFFSNSVNIPNINLGVAIQASYLKDIPVPGDKLAYGDLEVQFFIDENLENYLQVHDWMRALGFPESIGETIPLDINAVAWASPYINQNRKGASPKTVADVLKAGDVALFEISETGDIRHPVDL